MFGGVIFNKRQEDSFANRLVEFSEPDVVELPLIYKKMQKNLILVRAGDIIQRGSLVSKSASASAVNIYSPISGTVLEIIEKCDENGDTLPFARIENDGRNDCRNLPALNVIDQIRIIKRMSDAGLIDKITKNPTHVKYLSQMDRKLENLIINCVEVEPLVNTKMYMMKNNLEGVIKGVSYFAMAGDVKNIFFIFSQKDMQISENMKQFAEILSKWNVKSIFTTDKYPADNIKIQIQLATGRVLKVGESTTDFGTVVEDPCTCFELYNAIDNNTPLMETYISLYGEESEKNGVVLVKNGTMIEHYLYDAYAEKQEGFIKQIIVNGVMNGNAVSTEKLSVDVSMNAITFLTEEQSKQEVELPCIYCNKCADVCPMKLMPMWIDKALANGNVNSAIDQGALTCIGCGCCSYVCPVRRRITQRITVMKKDLQENKYE